MSPALEALGYLAGYALLAWVIVGEAYCSNQRYRDELERERLERRESA